MLPHKHNNAYVQYKTHFSLNGVGYRPLNVDNELCKIYGLGEGVKKNLNLFNLYYKKAMSINNKIIETTMSNK